MEQDPVPQQPVDGGFFLGYSFFEFAITFVFSLAFYYLAVDS